ncbi:hypothetical protein [Janthinobacterium psychrotolerans]|uniref:Uncharacterized protein n=1 Tax=Janthinobacterium psychrotolerans TaxID=1747903 RepID=A0A1A7BVZ1_9BURK|nr:hypothetical protein [Janthinobacterium psychrotolerans]OBV36680.1 hypothetical protein ASR47_1001152 [Janthinobacterium psychrotolerans]
MKNLLTIAGLAVLAALATAVLGFVALEVLPCSWFGGASEGACGYGVTFAVMGASPFVFLVLMVLLCIGYARRQGKAAQKDA